MKPRRFLMFLAPDDGVPEGGGNTALEILGDEGAQPVAEEPPGTAPEPTAPAFDPATFATQFGETFAKTFAQTQPQPEAKKELTPEEAAKLLCVWEPDEAWYAKYDNLETRSAAVKEQRDSLIKQADTIAQIRMQQMREEMDARYSPMVEQFKQREAQEVESRFAGTYPDLGKPELKPVISAVVQSFATEKKRFATETEMFKAVAERTESVIRATNPNFKLSVATTPRAKSDGGIPVTTPGAGGGSGGGTKNTATSGKGRALAILGPVG